MCCHLVIIDRIRPTVSCAAVMSIIDVFARRRRDERGAEDRDARTHQSAGAFRRRDAAALPLHDARGRRQHPQSVQDVGVVVGVVGPVLRSRQLQ